MNSSTSALLSHAIALCAALGVAFTAQAADPARGRTLYETRCWVCHETSVHSRSPRAAKSFDEVRGFVVRWDEELGGGWSADDVDDVAVFLNQKYYNYPCPPALYKANQALAR